MNNNLHPDNLKPEQSWKGAEQLLDRHFRNKRIRKYLFLFFIAGISIVSSVLIVNRFTTVTPDMKNMSMQPATKNTAPIGSVTTTSQNSIDKPATVPTNNVQKPVTTDNNINKSISQNHSQKNLKPAPSDHSASTASVNTKSKVSSSTSGKKVQTDKVHKEAAVAIVSGAAVVDSKNVGHENAAVSTASNNQVDAVDHSNRTEISTGTNVKTSTEIGLLNPINDIEVQSASIQQTLIPPTQTDYVQPPSHKNKNGTMISVYTSLGYVYKTLDAKDYPAYEERRKTEEDNILSPAFGASFMYKKNKIIYSIGAEYSSWGENANYLPYLDKQHVVDNGNWQNYSYIDTDTGYYFGNQYFVQRTVQDSTYMQNLDTITQSEYDAQAAATNGSNRYYYIEFPVSVSYRISESKIGLGVSAGLSPAILINEKGYYLKRDLSGTEKISDIESVNKFMLNGRFSFDIYYDLNQQFNFVLRPQFQANLGSIFKQDYGVNQKYYNAGLSFGAVYFLK